MNLVLMDVTESGADRIFRVKRFPAIIGKRRDATVAVEHDGVSRTHAVIVSRNSRFYLVDLGSLNGTRLHRVEGGDLLSKPAPVAGSADRVEEAMLGVGNELRDGLYLAVGGCVLKCVMEPEAPFVKTFQEPSGPDAESNGRRLAGLIGACVALVALTAALGFRNAGSSRSTKPAPAKAATQLLSFDGLSSPISDCSTGVCMSASGPYLR